MDRGNSRSWCYRVLLGLLVVSVSLALVAGCSKSPVSTSYDSTQTQLDWLNTNFGEDGSGLAKTVVNLKDCPVLYDTTIVQQVCQWGYQMDVIHGAERIGFSLPYMAVPGPVTLTIKVKKYQAPFGKFWMFDCGPQGLVFKYPLYVQPNQAARNGSVLVLFYYNPATGQWQVETTSRGSNPQVPIYHFSKYAIS